MSDKPTSSLPQQLSVKEDFPPVTWDQWRERVDKDLKGASFDKKLVTQTYEGFSIPPVISADTQKPSFQSSTHPSHYPWERGHRSPEEVTQGWDTRTLVSHPDPAEANKQALQELEKGAHSLEWQVDIHARHGEKVWGEHLSDLKEALREVRLDWAPMAFRAGADSPILAAALHTLYRQTELKAEDVSGAFHIDPLGTLAETGELPSSLSTALRQMSDVAAFSTKHSPNVRSVSVDTSAYHHAGCHEAQDLGIALSTGVAYLRAMEEAGLSIEEAASQLLFVFRVDSQFFKGIAKLRAARQLWASILQNCGVSDDKATMQVQVKPSRRAWTKRDPWVNLLRNTAVCFVGAVSGADIVTPVSFDSLHGHESELGRRIARNTSLILQDESHLHKVADPAGGSWFLEQLTAELVQRGWSFFQQLENKGGLAKALETGWLHEQLAAVQQERQRKLAKRRDPITGVSEFANLSETLPTGVPFDKKALQADRGLSMMVVAPPTQLLDELKQKLTGEPAGSWTEHLATSLQTHSLKLLSAALKDEAPASITPLPVHRFADDYEALRDQSDVWLAQHGQRPQVFLASLGTLAQHNGRTTFTRNLLAAGGFEGSTVNNEAKGYGTTQEAVAAFTASGQKLAFLCSSDGVYAAQAAETAKALKEAGAAQVWLAGRPGEHKDAWAEAGIDGYVYLGCDVIASLTELWKHLEETA